MDQREYDREGLELNKLGQYITAAEYSVSEKHEKEIGIEYYNKAVDIIKKLEYECSCR